MWPFRKPEWVSVADAARRAGVNLTDILQAARRRRLTIQVRADDLERWIRNGHAAVIRRVRAKRRDLKARSG
jgi:hypothetical protein